MRSNIARILKLAIGILIFLGVCAFLFLYFYKFPKEVSIVRKAVIMIGDSPASGTPTTIRIDGTLYRPVNRQHKFEGKFMIDGFDVTKSEYFHIKTARIKNGISMGAMFYPRMNPKLEIISFGWIYFDENFEKINIWSTTKMTTDNPASENEAGDIYDSMFIATGDDVEQAIETQRALREQFGDDWFAPKR